MIGCFRAPHSSDFDNFKCTTIGFYREIVLLVNKIKKSEDTTQLSRNKFVVIDMTVNLFQLYDF